MSELQLVKWLLSFIKGQKAKVFLAVLLGIISNLAVIAIPLLGLQTLLQMHQGVNPYKTLAWMVACGFLRGICRYLEQYLNHDIAFRLLATLRDTIFETIRRLGPAKLTGKNSGDLVTATTSDVEALEVFFAHTISPVLIAAGTTVVTVVYLGQQQLFLALLLLVGQLMVGVVLPVIGYRGSRHLGDAYQAAFVDLNQEVMENVASLQDIAQYQLEEKRLATLDATGKKLNQQYHERLKQESFLRRTSEIILLMTAVAILFVGMRLNFSSEIVLTATVLSLSSFGPVLALNGLGSALLITFASGRRLYELAQEQPSVVFSEKSTAPFASAQVKNISFSFEEKKILQNLNLNVLRGKKIGLGGESGNGKSTLLKLLMRYWDVDAGEIKLGEQNIQAISEADLHHSQGVMEQTTFIFEDSLFNNIALGKIAAMPAEVAQAAKKANLHQWIMELPEGYQTVIGGTGRSVSDGERQRIGLARLFLQGASLLLLDEPTSNLDYLNEQTILNTLKESLEDKTVLLVSHRETTLAITEEKWELVQGKLQAK